MANPGMWETTMIVEGQAASHRAAVEEIAKQIGSTLDPDNAQWMNRFTAPSRSSDRVYRVAQRRSDGSWGCDCWGWKRHRHCVHLAEILYRLSELAPAKAAAGQTGIASSVASMLESAKSAYDLLGGVK